MVRDVVGYGHDVSRGKNIGAIVIRKHVVKVGESVVPKNDTLQYNTDDEDAAVHLPANLYVKESSSSHT